MPFIQTTFPAPGAGEEQHIKILRSLIDQIGAIHVLSVAIDLGGSGYSVGDVVSLTGIGSGTPYTAGGGLSFDARFIVTSESGGVVDGLALESAGAYSVAPDPTDISIATVGAGNNDLTATVTVLGPYEAIPESGLEGTGYVVGDLFAVNDFTGIVDPQFRVLAVSSGAVTSTVQHTQGDFRFDEIPLAGSTVTQITGAGTGLEVNVNLIGWQTQRRDDVDDETDFEYISKGTNLSGNPPFIGLRTFLDTGSAQWNLMGCTGFNDLLPWHQQPGISPTFGVGNLPLGGGNAFN